MSVNYENIDYDGLLEKINQKAFVIDVRENHELIATGSLPNSVNIPRNVILFYLIFIPYLIVNYNKYAILNLLC